MPGLPNDPVGAGPDMSQWQNWLMSMLQPQQNQQQQQDPRAAPLAALAAGGGTPVNALLAGGGGAGNSVAGVPGRGRPQSTAPRAADPQPRQYRPAPSRRRYSRPTIHWPADRPIRDDRRAMGPRRSQPTVRSPAARLIPACPLRPDRHPQRRSPPSPVRRRLEASTSAITGRSSGNARQAQAMTYTDPNDPRIFRGPLAAPPATPPATQTIPPTATASVPPAPIQTARPDLAQRMPQDQWPQPPARPTGWPFNQ